MARKKEKKKEGKNRMTMSASLFKKMCESVEATYSDWIKTTFLKDRIRMESSSDILRMRVEFKTNDFIEYEWQEGFQTLISRKALNDFIKTVRAGGTVSIEWDELKPEKLTLITSFKDDNDLKRQTKIEGVKVVKNDDDTDEMRIKDTMSINISNNVSLARALSLLNEYEALKVEYGKDEVKITTKDPSDSVEILFNNEYKNLTRSPERCGEVLIPNTTFTKVIRSIRSENAKDLTLGISEDRKEFVVRTSDDTASISVGFRTLIEAE